MATKTMLNEKVADINRLINHQFTDEELNEKLRKQGALNNKANAVKRAENEKKIEQAMAAGDDAEVERLQAEAASLLPPKLAFTNNNPKPQVKKQSEHERLAELNLRNQKLNYENVRRAQLEERKASRKAAAAVARGEATANPFLRVRTHARTHYDVNNNGTAAPGDASRDATPGTGSDAASKSNTPSKPATPASSQKKPAPGGIAKIRHRNMDDENIAALDLDIDIEI